MSFPICLQCGVQYEAPREDCPICRDERQYIRWGGQEWTTLEDLRRGHRNRVEREGEGIWGIGSEPHIAIGQRALIVQTPGGNILWDCITLLDDETAARVDELGGISAIAISHPHYYGTMSAWSHAFGDVPIYVHAADREWLGRRDNVELWEGERQVIGEGLTLLNCGVHFDGGTVLHWAGGEGGAGALLSGDIFQVVMDRRYVSFMYSYPNFIPERPATVRRAVAMTEPFRFARIYGAFWGRIVEADGERALRRSAERYLSYWS